MAVGGALLPSWPLDVALPSRHTTNKTPTIYAPHSYLYGRLDGMRPGFVGFFFGLKLPRLGLETSSPITKKKEEINERDAL